MIKYNTNTFEEIKLKDLQHILITELPCVAERKTSISSENTVISDLSSLLNLKLNKKYNLIYKDESFSHAWDIKNNCLENTVILEKILTKNQDLFFMVIDNSIFVPAMLRKHKNCQVWPRKYFSTAFRISKKFLVDENNLQEKRSHWFCCVLGRKDLFRSKFFDWMIDNNLHLKNKVSYLAHSAENNKKWDGVEHTEDMIHSPKNFHLLPFNNFEDRKEIPLDITGRFVKKMPVYDCLFNIIVDTFAVVDRPSYTEKSLNSIGYGNFPIIISGPGSMKRMQEFGIILPDYIKWHYWDDIPVDQLNYSKIEIIQRQLIKLFKTHKMEDIASDWYPYALKNLNQLKNIEKNCNEEEKEICRWILTSCQNISNNQYQYLIND